MYLLDEELGMEKIGLVSENLAEIIADIATEAPILLGVTIGENAIVPGIMTDKT